MNEKTLKLALRLASILVEDECPANSPDKGVGWKIGSKYLIRTVTMAYTGILVAVSDQELWLSNACWIADTGRFNEALKGIWGQSAEHEPYPETEVIPIGRGALVDACPLSCELPKAVK